MSGVPMLIIMPEMARVIAVVASEVGKWVNGHPVGDDRLSGLA